MSIKSTIITVTAALAVMAGVGAGVGAAGTLAANAATPKCGSQCSDFYSRAFGSASVLDALNRPGRLAVLAPASRASQGEDFSVDALGLVRDLARADLVVGGLNALYGGLPAYEIEYTPGGSPTDRCLGVGSTPGAGTPVALEPCGVTARTVWIFDPDGAYYALISAATNQSFRHPFALTALVPGFPLVTAPLAAGVPASVLARQLWNARAGVLPSSLGRDLRLPYRYALHVRSYPPVLIPR
jgi:hypothetical protein